MRISKKIGLGFTATLSLLIIVSLWGVIGIGNIVKEAKSVNNGNIIKGEMLQREIDHLKWVANVNALLTDDNITELNVQTNHTLCGLGKWYYGEGRLEAERLIPSLKTVLAKMEEPHEKLHKGAVSISEVYEQADLTLPQFLAEKESDHLKWQASIMTFFLEKPEKLVIETDDHACGLGEFIYGAAGAEMAKSDPILAELLEEIKEPHERLHSSAKKIQQVWNNKSSTARAKAYDIFESESLPALKEVQDYLNTMKIRANERIEGMNEANRIYSQDVLINLKELQGLFREVIDITNENMTTDELMIRIAVGVRYAIGIFSFIAVVLAIILAFLITRSISASLTRVINELAEGSDQVFNASEQLSFASQELAEGSSEQASSIEETSSTLDETSSMVAQNTENTKQAAHLSQTAKESAEKGNSEMNEMSGAMNEIKNSSDEISKIIKVIDDIAFQTNILALNAAVEAARAGEAGMGFAVVAEEVRNLAQKSAQAAKNTASMIENSIVKSNRGVDIAKRVSIALDEIGNQSEKVNEIMDEITTASQEQTQGIIQITKAVSQMEQVTQSIASNAEESSAASEELSAQAQSMKQIVNQLKIMVYGDKENQRVYKSDSVNT